MRTAGVCKLQIIKLPQYELGSQYLSILLYYFVHFPLFSFSGEVKIQPASQEEIAKAIAQATGRPVVSAAQHLNMATLPVSSTTMTHVMTIVNITH